MRHAEHKGESAVGYGVHTLYQYGVSPIYVEILYRSDAMTSPCIVDSVCRKK